MKKIVDDPQSWRTYSCKSIIWSYALNTDMISYIRIAPIFLGSMINCSFQFIILAAVSLSRIQEHHHRSKKFRCCLVKDFSYLFELWVPIECFSFLYLNIYLYIYMYLHSHFGLKKSWCHTVWCKDEGNQTIKRNVLSLYFLKD